MKVSTSEGSCLADNVVTRTWVVTDGCGNASSATQVITLEDTTAPVVTFEANVSLDNVATSELDDFEGVEVIRCVQRLDLHHHRRMGGQQLDRDTS